VPNPITEAYVAVRPDFSGFAQASAAQAAAALRSVQVPAGAFSGSTAAIQGATAATAGLTSQTKQLSTATADVVAHQKRLSQSNLNLQAGLIGLGQGAASSRLAFFGVQGAVVSFAAAAGFAAVRSAADLEQSLNTLGVVARATKDELEQASQTAKQLGADITLPAVSATDGAEAILALARSGLELQDAMDGARGVLQLAAAAQTDNATAAIVTARALNAFNLAGREATRVADLLTGASIAGGASIEEIAVSLQQSAAAAATVNVSLSDTTNALALLARNGLAGSDAGTSLRTALLRLNPQTREARELTQALGIEVFNARGDFLGLPNAIEQYRRSLVGLTEEQRQAALATIFGQDAFRAISILAREGAAGFEQIAVQAEREGIAAEVAAARTSGLRGAFSALASQAETLGTNIGELALGPLTDVVESLSDVITAANQAGAALSAFGDIEIPGLGKTIGEDFGELAGTVSELNARLLLLGPVAGPISQVMDLLGGSADAASDGVDHLAEASGSLQTALRNLGADFSEAIQDLATPVDPASITSAIDQLERTLSAGGVAVGENFTENLQAQLAELEPRQALDSIRGLIVEATAAGADVGEALGLGIADGVRETQVAAVREAQRTLAEVVKAGQEAVVQSVLQAKSNLLSIGQSLASDFEQLVNAGPIGQQIQRLQDRLSATSDANQQRGLKNDLEDARRELEDAQASISRLGVISPEQKQAIADFLDPFRDKVKDAQGALDEFNQQGVIDKLTEARDAQIALVEQGIQDIIARFNAGQLTLQQTNTRLAGLLGNQFAQGKFGTAGKNLGFAFTEGFRENLAGLREQIAELVGFTLQPGATGTGQRPRVESPAATALEAQVRAQAARDEVQRRQRDLQQLTLDEEKNIAAILREIRNRLPKPRPEAPVRTPDIPSAGLSAGVGSG
jgi:TP901 family phage tail tape measure protein